MDYYRELCWLIQVDRAVSAGYETIAAFNTPSVAERYAEKCSLSNPERSYRVIWIVPQPVYEPAIIKNLPGKPS